MKILFISVNKEKGFRPAVPIGMLTVATAVINHNHQVGCLDLCFEDNNSVAIEDRMESFDPDIVGISIRNIDNQSFLEPLFHLPFVRRQVFLCRALKPACKIILGGPGFTLVPEEIMRYTHADFGIIGPGEESFPLLLEKLNKNKNIDDIPGLIYLRGDENIIINRPDFDIHFDSFSFPKRELYDKRYFSYIYRTPIGTTKVADAVESKRGCIMSCIYCANFKNGGLKFKLKDPARVVDEIEQIINGGRAERFEFTEGAFNLPYDHAFRVCEEMVKRKIHFPWNCMFNPGVITEELANLMARSGCDLVELGSESGSDTILKTLMKNFDVAQLKKTHRILTSRGIKAEHCIFIGSPQETRETILETFDTMEELVPKAQASTNKIFINFGYRIFEGTKLYDIALEERVLRREDSIAIPRFYISATVLKDESLLKLIEERVIVHDNWYLWWGLPGYSLIERVKEVEQEYKKIEAIYDGALDSVEV